MITSAVVELPPSMVHYPTSLIDALDTHDPKIAHTTRVGSPRALAYHTILSVEATLPASSETVFHCWPALRHQSIPSRKPSVGQ